MGSHTLRAMVISSVPVSVLKGLPSLTKLSNNSVMSCVLSCPPGGFTNHLFEWGSQKRSMPCNGLYVSSDLIYRQSLG